MKLPLTPEEQFRAALDEHIGCVKPYCFIRRADKEMVTPRSFDMEYNRVVNEIAGMGVGKGAKYADQAGKAAIASTALQVVRTICYRPDGEPIIDRKFNMWTDPGVKLLEGEPTIFLKHITYLIPNERERTLLLQWLAWIVQHPEQKVMFAILIIGRSGTGKSWLGKLMERIFGADSVVLISQDDMITEKFNAFYENKRFVFLHECPPDETAKLLDKMKGLVTETHIHVRRMRELHYKAENFANLMAISNEPVNIKLTNRRWAVIRAADDPAAPDGSAAHKKYYDRLWGVVPLDGTITEEARRVLQYLRTLPLDDFNRLVAPLTGTKQDAAETGDDGLVQARVANAYLNKEGPFRFNLLTAEEVARHIGGGSGRGLTSPMEEVGLRKLRRADGRDVQVTIDGKRPRLWAINAAVAKHHAKTDADDLVRLYKEERTGKPAAKPMDDIADDPMFADHDIGCDEATFH
jgi:hypothetical protein